MYCYNGIKWCNRRKKGDTVVRPFPKLELPDQQAVGLAGKKKKNSARAVGGLEVDLDEPDLAEEQEQLEAARMPVVVPTDDEGNGDNSNFLNNSAQNFSNPRGIKRNDNVAGPLSPQSRNSHRSELPNMASSSKPQQLRYTMSNFDKLGKKDGPAS